MIVSQFSILGACKKSDFLDKKPTTNILTPSTLTDFQNLLDNTTFLNATGGLAQLSADEYTVSYADWQTGSATERNAYVWAKDIYAGDTGIADWNQLYQEVFYANSVLDGLSKSDSAGTAQGQYIKGWALFTRAFAFYDLTRTFCKAYNAGTASTDLGIPLRLTSGIDYIAKRSTLQQSFDQVLNDLTTAAILLPAARPSANLNRPSKIAAYALFARINLDMRNYTQAESYADQCLGLYNTLIDYNTISITARSPFSTTNDELIYNTKQVTAYGLFTPTNSSSLGRVPGNIINLYNSNDLRLSVYFSQLSDGSYYRKRGYYGQGNYPFTGLATDEVYLIKAECLARREQTAAAMDELNQLLVKRYNNAGNYVPVTATSAADALAAILLERRKELMWRGLRWYDLKRLNMEGEGLTLTRVLNGVSYTLPPNDPRWVLPIPNDEIALSGIQQNPR
ncbi:SusD family protein [Mucilaginibacter gotjawali]|nr:SusD family protein [Mucilaginibacter gotjawali]